MISRSIRNFSPTKKGRRRSGCKDHAGTGQPEPMAKSPPDEHKSGAPRTARRTRKHCRPADFAAPRGAQPPWPGCRRWRWRRSRPGRQPRSSISRSRRPGSPKAAPDQFKYCWGALTSLVSGGRDMRHPRPDDIARLPPGDRRERRARLADADARVVGNRRSRLGQIELVGGARQMDLKVDLDASVGLRFSTGRLH